MSDKAYVASLPECDLCRENGSSVPANYDGKTPSGPWAFMCDDHFALLGRGLGTGLGQRLIVGEKPVETMAERRRKANEAAARGDMDAFMDAVGDGDPVDFL
jgi:hypothetical protein